MEQTQGLPPPLTHPGEGRDDGMGDVQSDRIGSARYVPWRGALVDNLWMDDVTKDVMRDVMRDVTRKVSRTPNHRRKRSGACVHACASERASDVCA